MGEIYLLVLNAIHAGEECHSLDCQECHSFGGKNAIHLSANFENVKIGSHQRQKFTSEEKP